MHSGQVIGNYRVGGSIGAGGMGQVWRATDTRLGRDVALKVLPEGFADDAERHTRFEREAKVLASLNHPHIATLYGLEHLDGQHVLVMELVEGEDLAQRIARGPIPVDEALAVALQIADALEAAHAAGIVHRDLKPANVRVRADGTVKVLDFGLAKGFDSTESGVNLAYSPTLTAAATAAGIILGTAAYMSPEQARGKNVDKRTDIWAFGVVVLEMLTGRQLFAGDTVTDVLAAVLTREFDWTELPAGAGPGLRRVLRRCLEKDPKRRYHDIGDVRIDLSEPAAPVATTAAPAVAPRRLPLPLLAGVALAALALGGSAGWLLHRPAAPARRLHVAIPPPAGTTFQLNSVDPGPAALSPDGRMLVFSVRDADGTTRLHVRPLDSREGRTLGGTEGCQYPFWSADSRAIGFFADGKLRRIEAAGGPALALWDAPNGKGGAWGPGGDILFAPDATSPLFRIAAGGGEAKAVTEVDRKGGENSHRHPRFLPDGRRFLYLSRRSAGRSEGHAVMAGSLDGGKPTLLVSSPAAAAYASGHLLFLRDTALMARRLDPERLELTGEAVPVAEDVTLLPGAALGVFTAAESGELAYQTGGGGNASMLKLYTRGEASPRVVGEAASYLGVRAAPDGKRAALVVSDPRSGTDDLWIMDLERGLSSRLTSDAANEGWPVWSPDGTMLYFNSTRGGSIDLYRRRVDGRSDDELLLASDKEKYPSSVTPDGRFLVYSVRTDDTGADLMALPLAGAREPRPLVATRFDEWLATISPDGRWLTYFSDESGRMEVYVTSFPDAGKRWRVSRDGGVYAEWTAGGRELAYHQPTGRIVAVSVAVTAGEPVFGDEKVVVETEQPRTGRTSFSFTPDGKRFLLLGAEDQPDALLHLVTDWTSLLPHS